MNHYIYSIVIPHYNSPHFLIRMLKSIPERDDIQVIVVDDASTRENVEALKQMHHTNFELYLEKENHGAGYARNVGLDHAQGKWVLVVDADDVFAENAFEVFDKYKDSDIDYLCYIVLSVGSDMKPDGATIVSSESIKAYCKNPNDKNLMLLKYRNLICRNKMVSMDFIRKRDIRFENSMVNNDVYFGLSVGHYAQKFIALPEILYYSVRSEGSITRKSRSIEREFLFYLQAQKRNGFYEAIGLKKWPYYRYDFLYILFMIKKRGFEGACQFFKYRRKHILEVKQAKKEYLSLLVCNPLSLQALASLSRKNV